MHIMTNSRIIGAPIGEVWAVTSSFGGIRAWMPDVVKCSLAGAGLGAVRTVEMTTANAVETLIELDGDKHRIRYQVVLEGAPIKGMTGGTTLTAQGPGKTKIEWTAEAESVDMDLPPFADAIRGFSENCFHGLARLLHASIE